MRLLVVLFLVLLALPAGAQRAASPHDGAYEGTRFQDCGSAGKVGRERATAEVRGGVLLLPGLPGDPVLEGRIGADGKMALPAFGAFRPGEGQLLEGANGARRITVTHPGRGRCAMVHELLRQAPGRRR